MEVIKITTEALVSPIFNPVHPNIGKGIAVCVNNGLEMDCWCPEACSCKYRFKRRLKVGKKWFNFWATYVEDGNWEIKAKNLSVKDNEYLERNVYKQTGTDVALMLKEAADAAVMVGNKID